MPVVLVAFALNLLLNLMLTEILLRDGRDLQILELMRGYVFRGRIGRSLSWVFFVLLGLSFIASLTAYVWGAGEVLAGPFGMAPLASRLLVYALSAMVVVFVTPPMYRRARREMAIGSHGSVPGWSLGRLGAPLVLALFVLGMALMAVGSFLGILPAGR